MKATKESRRHRSGICAEFVGQDLGPATASAYASASRGALRLQRPDAMATTSSSRPDASRTTGCPFGQTRHRALVVLCTITVPSGAMLDTLPTVLPAALGRYCRKPPRLAADRTVVRAATTTATSASASSPSNSPRWVLRTGGRMFRVGAGRRPSSMAPLAPGRAEHRRTGHVAVTLESCAVCAQGQRARLG